VSQQCAASKKYQHTEINDNSHEKECNECDNYKIIVSVESEWDEDNAYSLCQKTRILTLQRPEHPKD